MSSDANGWHMRERQAVKACRDVSKRDASPETIDDSTRERLLNALKRNFELSHRDGQLAKSSQITTAVRLLADPLVFPIPEGAARSPLLDARLEALIHILAHSPQRPVSDLAALALLDMALREGWTHTHTRRALECTSALKRSPEQTLGGFALASWLGQAGQEAAAIEARRREDDLKRMAARHKRTRLAELVGVVKTAHDSPALDTFVARALEAIFTNTSKTDRGDLADRLLRELSERHAMRGHDRWRLLVDPILAQNLKNSTVIGRIIGALKEMDEPLARPYFAYYLTHVSPDMLDRSLLDHLSEHGTRHIIPALYPLTQLDTRADVGLISRMLSRAGLDPVGQHAQQTIDAIIAREGLDAGGLSGALSVTDAGGGELSLIAAGHGALTLDEVPMPASGPDTLPVRHDRSRAAAALGVGLAMLIALAVLFALLLPG